METSLKARCVELSHILESSDGISKKYPNMYVETKRVASVYHLEWDEAAGRVTLDTLREAATAIAKSPTLLRYKD